MFALLLDIYCELFHSVPVSSFLFIIQCSFLASKFGVAVASIKSQASFRIQDLPVFALTYLSLPGDMVLACNGFSSFNDHVIVAYSFSFCLTLYDCFCSIHFVINTGQ